MAITKQQIQQYIDSRNETEYENRQFYNSPSDWGHLTPDQKRDEAIRHLEMDEFMETGLCPKCQGSQIEDTEGFVGETSFHCRECGYTWSDFSLDMVM